MQTIELKTWDDVSDYIDNGFFKIRMSQFEHLQQHGSYYPRQAYSKGQLASKSWLLDKLCNYMRFNRPMFDEHLGDSPETLYSKPIIAILGSWIGTLVDPLHTNIDCERIYGIDSDPKCIDQSERLNHRYLEGWRYKGVCADVTQLDCSNMQFETGGELIDVTPHIVINTSCEHMSTGWFDTVDDNQLIIMQTNNSEEFDGHINTCDSVLHMQEKYPLRDVRFVGEMKTPVYTRYMQIGYK